MIESLVLALFRIEWRRSENVAGIRMLPRDWELLNFIEEQGFATFRQIERMFFSNQKSFCSRRLGQLRCSGYLGKRTILEAITGQPKMSKNVKYFPHLLNINLDSRDEIYFINRKYAKAFGRSAKLFKPNMVLHQLILNEVRHFLDEEIPHQIVLNDSKVKISAKKEAGSCLLYTSPSPRDS